MTNFEEMKNKIDSKRAEIDELMAQFQKKLQGEFNTLTKAFFEETKLQAIAWTQYTPYFNDGDECTFGINDIYFIRNGFDPENLEDSPYHYEDDEMYDIVAPYCSWREGEVKDPLRDICDAFSDVINSNEGLMKDIFGDHTAVYLTADGVETREYEHE